MALDRDITLRSFQTTIKDIELVEDTLTEPIKVEMRVRQLGLNPLYSGNWIAGPRALVTTSVSIQEEAQDVGAKWLADLSKKLGVNLVPKWEHKEATGTAEPTAVFGYASRELDDRLG